MDIAALSLSMSQTRTLSQVGTAMLAKTMDTEEQMGAQMVKMIDSAAMERSVNPSVGGSFDISI